MSLNGIAAAALSALQTNSTALRVVSNNVANLNTQGYARRVVNEQTLSAGGQLGGVGVSDIQRITDKFLTAETLSASSSSARYDTQAGIFSQLSGVLGQPGDNTSLTAQLTAVSSALGQAALSPTSSTSQLASLNAFQNLAGTLSGLSSQISSLRSQVDQQVVTAVGSVNALIKQVYDLNTQVKAAAATGDDSSALLDQRDVALQNLSQVVGIRTTDLPDGRTVVSTEDGVNLVGDSYAQLSYSGGANNGSYNAISIQDVNPASGVGIAPPQNFDSHLASGQLKGLLDMRDGTLADLGQEAGNLARTTALAYNQANNANTSFPPPAALTGRNTGLTATDALNFTGKTTVAVADSSGTMVSRIDVDFDAQTISVNGNPATSFANTVGGFTTALNTALGANGTASFADGVLSVSAAGGNGVVVQDDATTPASRGGSGFSQFFGLNDLFRSAAPSILSTGLSASDAGNFAAGSQIGLQLKGPNGDVARSATVTLTAGMTVGNIVTALNTAMGGAATFTLNPDGSIGTTQSAAAANDTLNVTSDTTQRGTTGMSFTQLFGLGANQAAMQAQSFAVNPAVVASPQTLAFAKPQIDAATAAGDSIVGHGDNSGIQALQAVGSATQSFAKAGGMAAVTASLSDYAAAFYQDVATRSSAATASQTTQDDRLQEAQTRLSANSGVNLDEELTHMMSYQQAYSAGARMLTVVDQLFDTLLQIQ
ncbi:MAG: flagellar hook-associated protein FlgK [Rhizomicrobium sp.]